MFLTIAIALTLVVSTVYIHYEGIGLVSRTLQEMQTTPGRRKVFLAILATFAIHVVEISVYAFGLWLTVKVVDLGAFAGVRKAGLADYFYFSAQAFSSVGMGDIYPVGPLRLLASIEPINGLILIGWSTSFTYLGMQRYWSLKATPRDTSRQVKTGCTSSGAPNAEVR